MSVAFVTAALAVGVLAAAIGALVVWIVTLVTGSSDPWSAAPWVIAAGSTVVVAATYVAERAAHARTMRRMRSVGEPWAYREH